MSSWSWARGYKTVFMLNSTEHEISTAHNKLKCWKIMTFLAFKLSGVWFIKLINVKMPTMAGILPFMSLINFMLSCVENEKSFITSGPVEIKACMHSYLVVLEALILDQVFIYRPYFWLDVQARLSLVCSLMRKYEPWHVISSNVVFWQVQTQTCLCSLLLSLETPNYCQSVD